MNRLYTIKWQLSNGYTVSVSNFWNEDEAKEKMGENPEWTFTLEEETAAGKIWIAK